MTFLTLSAALLFVSTAAFAQTAPVSGTYEIDPAHSKVGFEIPHLVVSSVEGRFDSFKGTLTLGEKFEDSKVVANIDAASINTANGKRDEHLRSADFFDAKKFPTIAFTSKKVTGAPGAFKITGDLTMHGVTKEVTLDGKYLGTVKDATGASKAAFNAGGVVNRKDFGLNWGKAVEAGPVVGDEVTLEFKVQAAGAKVAAKTGK